MSQDQSLQYMEEQPHVYNNLKNGQQYYDTTLLSDDKINIGFSNKIIRDGFIRKVLGIVLCQLLVTSCICALFMYNKSVNNFVGTSDSTILYVFAVISMFVSVILISCCKNLRESYPTNYIILGVFTLSTAYTLGIVVAKTNTLLVMEAALCTIFLTLSLIIYSFQTKYDFTGMGTYLYTALMCIMLMGIISCFIHDNTYNYIYSGLGVILFSFYIVYDMQLIIGGKNKKHEFTPDDYVFAAMSLYLDIVNLFLDILSILNRD